ncbi:WbqC family protein [Halomonas nitroreducens]|uniref:Glycine transferase n=1 Tax=Halomonas nitroreducens TaxID=447425 RepID=A0A3S0R2P7_9GAMM|nr:WbqC family protein [Halomonas nitroreducens]RTR05328.1 hypothetical protein EKG36_07015 [Halomonas nitroreducens]
MKVAVMQPYLFPYLGYYQLAKCVDTLVLYDDVNYIPRGYINRNYILYQGRKWRFTVPVMGASIHKKIYTLSFSRNVSGVLQSIRHAYSKAPYFDAVFPMVEEVLEREDRDITDMCSSGIREVLDYLEIGTPLLRSSRMEYNKHPGRSQNLMEICSSLGACEYVNSPGGRLIYDKKEFSSCGYNLSFLEPREVHYNQGKNEFVPNLSMIDVLMWCSKDQAMALLDEYDIV